MIGTRSLKWRCKGGGSQSLKVVGSVDTTVKSVVENSLGVLYLELIMSLLYCNIT